MLTKRRDGQARRTRLQNLTAVIGPVPVNRRAFLQRSGLVAGGLAAAGTFQLGTIRKVAAISPPQPGIPIEIKKSICTHCAVGCTVTAEVQKGVWTGQETTWDSPINRGSHCVKSARVRALVHCDSALTAHLTLVTHQWTRDTWEEAL